MRDDGKLKMSSKPIEKKDEETMKNVI